MNVLSGPEKDGQQLLSRENMASPNSNRAAIVKNVSNMPTLPFNVKGGHTNIAVFSSIMDATRAIHVVFRSVVTPKTMVNGPRPWLGQM